MEWTISSTDRNWLELADILRREWQGSAIDRQRALDLAGRLGPNCPDMRHTLAHLRSRLGAPTH